MNTYIIALELFLFAFSFFILLTKGEMALLYLPVVFFCDTVTDNHFITAFAYYAIISVILLKLVSTNQDFLKNNYFSGLLVLYFIILMTKATNLAPVRSDVFNVIWYFSALPLIVSIYKKHSKNEIFKELANSCFLILSIFIISVLASTYFKYNPYEMYGITGGLLYGNLYATDFNIIAPSIFILLLYSLNKRNYLFLLVTVISLVFICLSMRRSVMAMTGLGVVIVTFLYLSKNVKKILPFTAAAVVFVFIVVFKTDFAASMQERYELRNLEERGLDEEQRYFEYRLLYDDVFHYKRYSPWIGFNLFNSPGNYGGGKFYDRSLHGDITSIGHSSGLIGIALYFIMVFSAFYTAWKATENRYDKLIVLFCAIAFTSYCLTGRFTQVGCMMMLFLVANLSVAKEVPVPELVPYEEKEDDPFLLKPVMLRDSYLQN